MLGSMHTQRPAMLMPVPQLLLLLLLVKAISSPHCLHHNLDSRNKQCNQVSSMLHTMSWSMLMLAQRRSSWVSTKTVPIFKAYPMLAYLQHSPCCSPGLSWCCLQLYSPLSCLLLWLLELLVKAQSTPCLLHSQQTRGSTSKHRE